MDLREATEGDIEEIRSVATKSLTASYAHALDEEIIEAAVDRWYDEEQLTEDLTDEDAVFVIAVEQGDVVGFAQSYVVERRDLVGEIDWLHVVPDHRGEGFGKQLLARVEQELVERGVERVEARVLEENEAGAGFYEGHGFDKVGERDVDIADRTFVEQLYSKFPEKAEGRQVLTESREGPEDQQLFIAFDESERAQKAPFYPAYKDHSRADRHGYFCGNCESFDVAVDSMGRVECNNCGNRSKPTRWDAAYL